jgi:hypothetical protein
VLSFRVKKIDQADDEACMTTVIDTTAVAVEIPTKKTIDDYVADWFALDRQDKAVQWHKARVCAYLERDAGRRDGGETEIQEFCCRVNIGAGHFSRMAKTFRMFVVEPVATGSKKYLVDDDRLSFKHFLVAANYSKLPKVAIAEAVDRGWSANELARWLKRRNDERFTDRDDGDGEIKPQDDDDQPDVRPWQPQKWDVARGTYRDVKKDSGELPKGEPRGTVEEKLLMTVLERTIFRKQLRALASVIGTSTRVDTAIATVRRAYDRWLNPKTQVCPRCGEDIPPGDAPCRASAGKEDEEEEDEPVTRHFPKNLVFYSGPSLLTGDPIVAIAGQTTSNRKTGPCVQVWILRADVSPIDAVKSGGDSAICGTCRHRGHDGGQERSCYVTFFREPHNIWRSLPSTGRDVSVEKLANLLSGKHVRLGAYGDPAALPFEIWEGILRKASGWTAYTHQWRTCDERFRSIAMASVDSPEEKEEASRQGWRTFRVRRPDQPVMDTETTCPASIEGGHRKQCATCGLCCGAARPAKSIAILAHGSGARHFALTLT